jgi:hypothetical protein
MTSDLKCLLVITILNYENLMERFNKEACKVI